LNKFWYSHYQIYSTDGAFAALKADGSITAWGDSNSGGTGAPSSSGYSKIYSTDGAFAALIEPLVLRAAKVPSVE
jgi:hypothetical protein